MAKKSDPIDPPAPVDNMEGHPADVPTESTLPDVSPSDPPTAPELKDVMIGGQVFKVDPLTAAAIEAQKAYTEQQLAQLKPAPVAPIAPTAPAVDYENLMFTDPAGYTQKVIEEAQRRAEASLTTRYQQQRGLDDFMTQFYTQNEDLKIADDLVRMELQANIPQWGNKPVAEAQKLLADKVRERVFGYVKHFSAKPGQPSRTVVEGGRQPAVPVPTEEKVIPTTVGDLLAKRRELRRGKS